MSRVAEKCTLYSLCSLCSLLVFWGIIDICNSHVAFGGRGCPCSSMFQLSRDGFAPFRDSVPYPLIEKNHYYY